MVGDRCSAAWRLKRFVLKLEYMNKKIIIYASVVVLAVGLVFLANGLVLAWDWPSSNPTGGNVAPPLAHSDAAFNSDGRLNIDGGADYWIGKYWDSFTLHNDGLYRRLTLGQDGALEVRGRTLGGETVLFNVGIDGYASYASARVFKDLDDDTKYLNPDSISKINDLDADTISAARYNDIDNTSFYIDPAATSKIYRTFITGCRICLGWADLYHDTPDRTQCHSMGSMVRDNGNFLQLGGDVGGDDRLWIWFECD